MNDLDKYRKEIDDIDAQILQLLARRQAQVIKVAHLKQASGLKAHQPARHQQVIENREKQAIDHGLNPAFIAIVWRAVMAEAIRIQDEVLTEEKR